MPQAARGGTPAPAWHRSGISGSACNGLDSPTTEGDLEDLTADWTVSNDGIDLFIPHNMNIPSNGGMILGKSAIDGPCDKNAKGMTGATCGLWGSEQTARTFAHELGHYLVRGSKILFTLPRGGIRE